MITHHSSVGADAFVRPESQSDECRRYRSHQVLALDECPILRALRGADEGVGAYTFSVLWVPPPTDFSQ